MNLKRLQRLTERLSRQSVSNEFASLLMHKREGRWVAAVEGGGHGELLSPPLARAVVLRWFLAAGEEFPRHHHPFSETLVVERGRCLFDGEELGPGDEGAALAQRPHSCTAITDSVFFVIWDQNRIEFAVDQSPEGN